MKPESYNVDHELLERKSCAGLLMIVGFCAVTQPLSSIASGVGTNGILTSGYDEIAYWQFVGSCCMFANGILSIILGYFESVHDYGKVHLYVILVASTQVRFGCSLKLTQRYN